MLIDAHHHFWRYRSTDYPWIDESMRVIRTDFLAKELAEELIFSGVEGTVAVQARQSIEETAWLLQVAQEHAFVRGVVGWVPLADRGVAGVLDEFSVSPFLKGVRHVVQDERNPSFLEGRGFNAGIRELTSRGLSYDLLIHRGQLSAAIAFVDRHPKQVFILDHLAKPQASGVPDPEWTKLIHELATRENVYCKVSGLATEAPGRVWTADQLRPYFDVILEAFGPRRMMFGSDWPVCLLATGYLMWFRFVQMCASGLSPAETESLFGGTATEAYRLS